MAGASGVQQPAEQFNHGQSLKYILASGSWLLASTANEILTS